MISKNRLAILQHSLGLNQYGQGRRYRNHFVTGDGSTDYPDCIALVEAGFMLRRSGNEISGGNDVFTVTQEGIDYVALNSQKPPKLSRSKLRYLRYLEYGDCFDSFIHFCRWDALPDRSWNRSA